MEPDALSGTIAKTEEFKFFLKELADAKEPCAIPLDKQLETLMSKERELNRTTLFQWMAYFFYSLEI
jgi:hypothetical protein